METQKLTHTHIVREYEHLTTMILSIRAFTPYSAREHARRLVYCELLTAGTRMHTREQFQNALGVLGADISVSLDAGYIDVIMQTTDSTVPKVLALIEAMLIEPTFPQHELKRIKTLLTNTLTDSKEDARSHAYRLFAQASFTPDDRRAVFDIDALITEISRVTVSDIRTLHAILLSCPWHYTAGGKSATLARIQKKLTHIHPRKISGDTLWYTPRDIQSHTETNITLRHVPSKQNIEFSIGGTIPITRTHHDYPALLFGISVLGLYGGFTGRLMSTVREKEGLTYGIYARIESLTSQETGVWRIMTFFSPRDTIRGITSTLREIRAIHTEGITEAELNRFKQILVTRYTLIEDSLIKKVAEAHTRYKTGISEDAFTLFKRSLTALTCEQVHKALQTYLSPDALIICGAGPILTVKNDLAKLFPTAEVSE
ncbi:MAG TPA: insulinase family protein [Candidatus Paceibacterota bacterium]|nr:insulinase family protein [Candidatus Paceibacterota bacterium]